MSRTTFHRFAWATLVYNLGIIVWGAFVRATGSGAGCGNNWPTCNGEVVPRAPQLETLIEYTHRLTSGVALVLVLVLTVMAFRIYPLRHRVRRAAATSLAFILVEAAIGAGLVLLELVGDNASMARAAYLAVHLTNTFFLLTALSFTAEWAGGASAPTRWTQNRLSRPFWASVGAMLVVGVSGAIAALGDTLYPATSLGEGIRQDFSAGAPLLLQLRVLHPFLAFTGSLVLLYFVAQTRQATKRLDHRRSSEGMAPAAHSIGLRARRHATRLNLLVLTQLAVGSLNIVLLAPVWMQLIHLLMADLTWIALMLTGSAGLAAITLPAPTPAGGEADQPSRSAEAPTHLAPKTS